MSQKSSLPHVIQFVSEALMPDKRPERLAFGNTDRLLFVWLYRLERHPI
jgi:hypothetical protein